MTRKIGLSINDAPIKLDYFVQGFIDHVIAGMLVSLHDTGEIEKLELSIDSENQVTINLNEAIIPVNPFVNEIVGNTIKGMVSNLKGVSTINRLTVNIER